MLEVLSLLLKSLENLWLSEVREVQREYNKPILLNPNDGSDWKRELI